MHEDSTDIVLEQIHKGLEQFDLGTPIHIPDSSFFERMVIEEKKRLRKRFLKDIILFWSVAMCILFCLYVSVTQVPVLYWISQALVIALMPIYLLLRSRKRVSSQ